MPIRRVAAHRGLALFATLIVAACGSQPATPPPSAATSPGNPSDIASASGDPAFAAMLANAIANAGQPVGDISIDTDRADLLYAMGVPTALGADADRILALVAATEEAALSQQPIPAGSGRTSLAVPGGDGANSQLILAAFKKFNGMTTEFPAIMAGNVKAIGLPGPATYHIDLGTDSNTGTDGAISSTTQMHRTADIVFAGSDVKVTIVSDIHNNATDTTTGSSTFTETMRVTISGELDACPSAAGLVPGSLDRSLDEDATTFPSADGRGGSHATGHIASSSEFQGTVDETATLGRVSQTYTHDEKWKRSASADGGPASEGAFALGESGISDGVSTDTNIGPVTGDWSGAKQTKAERSGDATAAMIDSLRSKPGHDWATMEASYVVAQELWRDSRCVIVTAPAYIPASAFENNRMPTHTEEVDKGSTTQFEVGLDHRFKQPVTGKITAQLDGKESLSPDQIQKPPGNLTYVAPDQNGIDAKVLLESISRQGIGRLTLTFRTGTTKLRVSINGTMTSTVAGISYTTTLHASNILLTKTSDPPECSKDGIECDFTFAGSGPATAQVIIPIPDCSKPYVEKGTFKLKAKHKVYKEEAQPAKWEISWDPATTLSFKGGLCVGLPLDSFLGAGDAGPLAGFMTVLANVEFGAQGGEKHVKRTVPLGSSTNVIDATVKAEVVSE